MANTRKFTRAVESARRVEEKRVADAAVLSIIDEQLKRLADEFRQIEVEYAELSERRETVKEQHQEFERLRAALVRRFIGDAGPLPTSSQIDVAFTLDDAILAALQGGKSISTNALIGIVQAQSDRLGTTPTPPAIRSRLYKRFKALGIRKEKDGKECYWSRPGSSLTPQPQEDTEST